MNSILNVLFTVLWWVGIAAGATSLGLLAVIFGAWLYERAQREQNNDLEALWDLPTREPVER